MYANRAANNTAPAVYGPMYQMANDGKRQVYRSDDGGKTWALLPK